MSKLWIFSSYHWESILREFVLPCHNLFWLPKKVSLGTLIPMKFLAYDRIEDNDHKIYGTFYDADMRK